MKKGERAANEAIAMELRLKAIAIMDRAIDECHELGVRVYFDDPAGFGDPGCHKEILASVSSLDYEVDMRKEKGAAQSCGGCREMSKVHPIGKWGRRPFYSAKVGTGPGTLIQVKRARTFEVGQGIEFCETDNVRGMAIGCTPKWSTGKIWKIEYNRLFLELI